MLTERSVVMRFALLLWDRCMNQISSDHQWGAVAELQRSEAHRSHFVEVTMAEMVKMTLSVNDLDAGGKWGSWMGHGHPRCQWDGSTSSRSTHNIGGHYHYSSSETVRG